MPDDQTPDPAAAAEPNAAAEPAAQGDPADKPLGPGGERALAAERDARKVAEKSATDLAARLKEIETANLSELERAQQAAKESQEAAAKASTEALRWRTAAKHGISDEDAETFLTGTDEATITRQAERLASLKSGPSTPRPDRTQGGSGGKATGGTPGDQFANFLSTQLGTRP